MSNSIYNSNKNDNITFFLRKKTSVKTMKKKYKK